MRWRCCTWPNAGAVGLTAFEFIPRLGLEFVLRNISGARDPFAAAHPWYVLIEVSGAKADGRAGREMEAILAAALDKGLVLDAVLARSSSQAADLWRLREAISEAQKPEGGNVKHDIAVPIARIPEFIARANVAVEKVCPGARPLPVGHFGDGNIHYNIVQPAGMDKATFLAQWDAISDVVHDLVTGMGGSISAEHGIGRMKRAGLARSQEPGRDRTDARHQECLRPQRHHEPRQGAVSTAHHWRGNRWRDFPKP